MRIGILAAMKVEMEKILDSMDSVEDIKIFGSKFFKGYIGNNEVCLVECGMGKVNAAIAATLLIREFECSFIINTGIAGGVKPLKHRDVVIATSLEYHDVDATIFGYKHGQVPGMPAEYIVNPENILMVKRILNKLNIEYKATKIYSGDQFISSLDDLKNVELSGGFATEMEGTAVAQACTRAGVDFIVLRYISDVVGEENQEESYFEFESDMANESADICIQLIENIG